MDNTENFVLGWMDNSFFTAYHTGVAQEIGVTESIILSKLVQFYNHWKKKGELSEGDTFFVTIEKMDENTAIKESAQRRAISKLKKLGLIDSFAKGLPAKRYFKLNINAISELMKRGAQNKNRQSEGTDNHAEKQQEKDGKPRHDQNRQSEGTRAVETKELDLSKQQGNKENLIKDLKKEEEEEGAAAIINFLVDNGHKENDAKKFAARVRKLGVTGFNNDQILEAINRSLKDYERGACESPYIWAAKKLKDILNTPKSNPTQEKKQPQRKKTGSSSKLTRIEPIPESWKNENKPQEPEIIENEEERRRKLEELFKNRK